MKKRHIVGILMATLFLMILFSCKRTLPKDLESTQTKLNLQVAKQTEAIKNQIAVCVKYNNKASKLLNTKGKKIIQYPRYDSNTIDYGREEYFICMEQMKIYNEFLDKHGIDRPNTIPGVKDLPDPGSHNASIKTTFTTTTIPSKAVKKCEAELTKFKGWYRKIYGQLDDLKKQNKAKKIVRQMPKQQPQMKKCASETKELEYNFHELACVCCDANLVVIRQYANDGSEILGVRRLNKKCASNCRNHNLVRKTNKGCQWDIMFNPKPTPAEQLPPLESKHNKKTSKKRKKK